MPMLDERKAAILRAVVEQYIETAQPVGSSHVAHKGVVDVSPATVRNEMAVLEREGFLVQPHTSAGRIPTDKGYRYYVDQIAHPGPLPAPQRQTIKQFFDSAHGAIEQMLHDTSRLLSDLTDTAAVVVGPAHEAASIRAVQVVGLAPNLALLVVVLSNGVIEKRTLDLAGDTPDERLAAAGRHLTKVLAGRTLHDVGQVPAVSEGEVQSVVDIALRAVAPDPREDDHTEVFVSGASRVARAFPEVETVRDVLHILEQQYLVVSLLRDVLDRGLSVAIGAEAGLEPLAECAIVVAPYEIEGERAGTIGILGPTRMNYPQALSAVSVVSERLGRRLTEG